MREVKRFHQTITGVMLGMTLWIQPAAWAGLPTAYKALPEGLVNSTGVPLLAAQDEKKPKVTSKSSVYYFPGGIRKMPINIQNFNSTVLGPDGKRGNMCISLDKDFVALNVLTERYDSRIIGLTREEELIANRLNAAEEKEATECAETVIAESDVAQTKELLNKVNSDLVVAPTTVATCLGAPNADAAACNQIIATLVHRRVELEMMLNKQSAKVTSISGPCTKMRKVVLNLLADYKRIDDQVTTARSFVDGHWTHMKTLYGNVDGGALAASWDDGFEDAKKEIESKNPGISVLSLPKRLLNFYMGGWDKAGDMPFALSSSNSASDAVKVLEKNGVLDGAVDPKKETVEPNGTNAKNPEDGKDYFSLLAATPFRVTEDSQAPTAGALSLHMTVSGACAIMAQKAAGTGKNGVVISASYIFGNGSNVHVKASYNLWNIYKKIESSGTRSGGFLGFSKSAYHNMTQSIKGGDDFNFTFYAEDPVEASKEEKIRQELKAELMNRIATTLGQFTANPAHPPLPARAEYPGDVRLTWIQPSWSFYGTVAFKTVENMFGSSSANSSIEQNWNRTVSEEWNYTRITPMVATHVIELTL